MEVGTEGHLGSPLGKISGKNMWGGQYSGLGAFQDMTLIHLNNPMGLASEKSGVRNSVGEVGRVSS